MKFLFSFLKGNDINAGINESGRFCWIAVNNDRESFYYFWDCLVILVFDFLFLTTKLFFLSFSERRF